MRPSGAKSIRAPQTAREIEVAFPVEFTPEQRRKAGLGIGQWIVGRYGSAADIAWHEPSRKGDERNYHAHILFTTRAFDENGQWAKTKGRTLDDRAPIKNERGEMTSKGQQEIGALRAAVAGVLNDIAAREKHQVYVEHLSFKERGLDREPTQHMGPNATEMQRRGAQTDIGDKNRAVQDRNDRRGQIYEDRKVVNIEEARERKRQQGAGHDAGQNESPVPRPQYHPAHHVEAWAPFYEQTAVRRQALLEELDARYGQQEKDMRQHMAQLHHSIDDRGFFVRFWRRVTGREREEKERLQKIEADYDAIQKKKQEAAETLERDRQQEMRRLQQQLERDKEDQEPMPDEIGPDVEIQETNYEEEQLVAEVESVEQVNEQQLQQTQDNLAATQEIVQERGQGIDERQAEIAALQAEMERDRGMSR